MITGPHVYYFPIILVIVLIATHPFKELTFPAKKNRRGKLLCFVLTMPRTHDTRAKAVARTWGPGFADK